MKERTELNNLFLSKDFLCVCAPMVRYSKLEFRTLVRRYGCDLCFTPMIMADSFVQSEKARQNELSTSEEDTPLVVQFAAKNVEDFVNAAELVSPYCDGVDLNCGCPQRWAMSDGYGARLLSKPELVQEIVRTVRNRISRPFTVSVKIRILEDIRKSVDLCQSLEAAGASFVTVHGRTVKQSNDKVNTEAIKEIVQSVNIPVIANGGVKNYEDVILMKEKTYCKGVMSAQGVLNNPTLFQGETLTTISCVQEWLNICLASNINFQCFHHHLVFMCEKLLKKEERNNFNRLNTVEAVTSFLNKTLKIKIPEITYNNSYKRKIIYSTSNTGKYFKSKLHECEDLSSSWLYN